MGNMCIYNPKSIDNLLELNKYIKEVLDIIQGKYILYETYLLLIHIQNFKNTTCNNITEYQVPNLIQYVRNLYAENYKSLL